MHPHRDGAGARPSGRWQLDDEQLAALLTAAEWRGLGGIDVHRYAVTAAAGCTDELLDLVDAYEMRGSVTAAGCVLGGQRCGSR